MHKHFKDAKVRRKGLKFIFGSLQIDTLKALCIKTKCHSALIDRGIFQYSNDWPEAWL